jgi:hypothetical protein
MGLLKNLIKKREKEEPFSESQKRLLNKRDRNFVRVMQISNAQHQKPSDLQSTIKDFHKYKKSSRTQKNKIKKGIDKSIEPFNDTQLSRKVSRNIIKENARISRQNKREIHAPSKGLPEKPLSKTQQKELKKEVEKLKTSLVLPRFLRIAGKAQRYFDTEKGEEISRRQRDIRNKQLKEENS